MSLQALVFFVSALIAIVSAILMITRANPVKSAIFLIINFLSLSIIYLTLNAQFIAIIQVLVYAGAIMVLFVFVIMLLNLQDEKRLSDKLDIRKAIAFLFVLLVFSRIALGLGKSASGRFLEQAKNSVELGKVESIGEKLFTSYILPFEITSLILIVAIVGSIVLAKRKFE
ncbi:NADH-quinone oxidoreductase subunit J [Candidatus Kryptonium thompsonii]|uniref:NADH-quinone oxidoreductase subunit J n=1 Tax=Candidatus Kryptonium thompsonii TaxID=1633631 RepID=A0A0P1MJ03_9BACT|nr:NADH-quinone oxidoreductase subunit J [Candidatus Kryptonium thompsoni]CUS79418.1 NADH-quinone oxidoreductase subunit J [Candidatus Kryptonium thompsoni]CUS81017.1 NADH-quinone oxidoreductase subunit J [Candidatus Kryptonium thompsoni]CUS87688.1 NADH-quinone oxidoreductase subunit J [Candidatus Kryptonium thompsoni]CUS88842.1 NADH-quinone oxidoreductase subunit J [Candidatus Kryptonium thompsoni]CUS91776.1 NADH-quinone oxidoreductase subunit J [Candidatus Kryptonium thompsoni]